VSQRLCGRRWEAVVLAAGASSRMGFPKALLEWGNTPLLVSLVREIIATRVAKVAVVLGAEADRVRRGFEACWHAPERFREPVGEPGRPRLEIVINRDWPLGKTTSIRTGVEALSPTATDLLLLTVDQPLRAEVMEAVMGAHETLNQEATIPAYGGRRGHPVALSLEWREELMRLSEEREGLRELFGRLEAAGRLAVYELAAPCVLWNFNQPQDVILAMNAGADPLPYSPGRKNRPGWQKYP